MKRDHESWAEQKFRAETAVSPGGAPESGFFDHVPESIDEVKYVIGHRPQSWEYLMYAGLLQVGVRDARCEGVSPQGASLVFSASDAALYHISTSMNELKSVTKELMSCFEPGLLSKALGEPGRAGEFRLIYDIADRLIGAYKKLISWEASARAAQVPSPARRLYDLLSSLADMPMRGFEQYVSQLAAELNEAAHGFSLGEHDPIVLSLVYKIRLDAGVSAALMEEMERLHQWIVTHHRK